MAKQTRIGDSQRAGKIPFGNMVNARDHMNSHPVANSAHIARLERVILLLETTHRLVCINSSEAHNPQHEEQEQAEHAQLDTFTRRAQLPLTLSLAQQKASKRYIA